MLWSLFCFQLHRFMPPLSRSFSKKNENAIHPHIKNGSGVMHFKANGRSLENNQQREDGSILVPKAFAQVFREEVSVIQPKNIRCQFFRPFLNSWIVPSTVFHSSLKIIKTSRKWFSRLKEEEKMAFRAGKDTSFPRAGAMVAALECPKNRSRIAILASHTDSPLWKAETPARIINRLLGQLGTECYGSPILHSWLDRDLIMAGKIVGLDKNGDEVSVLWQLKDERSSSSAPPFT